MTIICQGKIPKGFEKYEEIVYIGRKAPKGYVETGGTHLGKGLWILNLKKKED